MKNIEKYEQRPIAELTQCRGVGYPDMILQRPKGRAFACVLKAGTFVAQNDKLGVSPSGKRNTFRLFSND
jgi:hypothetical protein